MRTEWWEHLWRLRLGERRRLDDLQPWVDLLSFWHIPESRDFVCLSVCISVCVCFILFFFILFYLFFPAWRNVQTFVIVLCKTICRRFLCTKTYILFVGYKETKWWWLGEPKVSCFACSWARPAVLAAGKGKESILLFLVFLHFHSFFCFSPVPSLTSLLSLFSLSPGDNTKWPTRVDVTLNPNTIWRN